jgi:hypothetical protein
LQCQPILRAFLTYGHSIGRPRLRQPLTLVKAKSMDWHRMPVAHLKAESPNVQASAPRVFHLNRHDLAPWVIHLDGCALAQTLAPWVFHLNYHAAEQTPAAGIFRLNGRDLGSGIFHLDYHLVRQAFRPAALSAGSTHARAICWTRNF